MTDLFLDAVTGDIASSADYNTNWNLTQNSFSDLGPYVISGLTLAVGSGLAVTVAAGVASIGARITAAGSFSVAGLTDGSLNYVYLKDDGTGTSNLTGTNPADSVKLGTATTSGGVVTSTNILRDSGRQARVRTESLVPGGPSAGNPASINLAAWAAAAANSVTVYGTLPTGALPTISLDSLSDVNLPAASQGDILYRNASEWVRLTAGATGKFLKTLGTGANPSWEYISSPVTASVAGLQVGEASKSTNYTLTNTDTACFVDTTSGNITITLPTAVGIAGRLYVVKKVAGGNNVVVQANGAENIDGANTAVITTLYASISILSDNANWWIF